MRARFSLFADPMIAVLIAATLLAIAVPASGEARGTAQLVSNIAIFVLFLVNGMRIARGEIARGLANWRFFLPLFLWVFGAMPLLGMGLSALAAPVLPPLVALGFLYLGTLPSTVQSATSYTSLAGGNVALSVVGAALINIAGVFITAPLFAGLAGSEVVAVGNETIIRIGLILILPFVIGQAVQGWAIDWLAGAQISGRMDRSVRNRHRGLCRVFRSSGAGAGYNVWLCWLGGPDRLNHRLSGPSERRRLDAGQGVLLLKRGSHSLPVCWRPKKRRHRRSIGRDIVSR